MKKTVAYIALSLSILTITGCERGWIWNLVSDEEEYLCNDESACNYQDNNEPDFFNPSDSPDMGYWENDCLYLYNSELFDCSLNCLPGRDCNWECGGTAVEDNCGVCDSDPDNDCDTDCNGTWGGSAVLDECGVCNGANSDMDCNGDCFGTAFIDDCGNCVGGNTFCTADQNWDIGTPGQCTENWAKDCNNICKCLWDDCPDFSLSEYGGAYIDDCGVCVGGNTGLDENDTSDECGVCGGDNSTCLGCDGVPNSGLLTDMYGVCGGNDEQVHVSTEGGYNIIITLNEGSISGFQFDLYTNFEEVLGEGGGQTASGGLAEDLGWNVSSTTMTNEENGIEFTRVIGFTLDSQYIVSANDDLLTILSPGIGQTSCITNVFFTDANALGLSVFNFDSCE